MNLPDSEFISAPLWLIHALHVVTLTLHFLAMNFLAGGLMVVLTGRIPDRWHDATVRRFIRLFPSAMAATVTLGIAPLLFVQLVYSRLVYPASIVSGWFWFMIPPAVILAYYLLYAASFRSERSGRSERPGAAGSRTWLWIAALALIYVSLVYSSVFSMAERPDLIRALYARKQSGLTWNPNVSDYILRWLHMFTGTMAVGGFFFGLIGRHNPAAFQAGKKYFLCGTVMGALTGFAYLVSLGSSIAPFMRTPGAWSLTVSVLASLGALHFFFKRRFVAASLVLFLSMLSMVLNRHFVRLVHLQGQFDPASWKFQPQWSPLLIFLACFVAAIGLLWYMLRLFFRGKDAEG